MDVRNWSFLEKQLDDLGSISDELEGSPVADRIAYTAFFWTLLNFAESQTDDRFRMGAMSLPDELTSGIRARIEALCRTLDEWLTQQDAAAHPKYADLRRVVEVGLHATTHPVFGPPR